MVTTTALSSSSSTTCGTSAQYELPVQDAACGVPNSSKYKSIIEECAKPAGVLTYDNDCAIYALAIDQSVSNLTQCLYKAGVSWKDVWCFGSTNSTATATSYPTATATGTLTSTKDTALTATGTSTSTSTSTSTPNSSSTIVNTGFNFKSALLISTLFVPVVLSTFWENRVRSGLPPTPQHSIWPYWEIV